MNLTIACRVALALLLAARALTVNGQLSLVKNINTQACSATMLTCSPTCLDQGSSPSYIVSGNGKVYFFATDNVGTELWESDGSTTGTLKISSFGSNYSSPKDLVYLNNLLCFTAKSPLYGNELFAYNLASHTYQVIDINLGNGSSDPSGLAVINNQIAFSAIVKTSLGDFGRELVYSNGFSFYTKDLRIGTASSNPSYLELVNNDMYFSADGNNDGQEKGIELWKDAGTPSSIPLRLADINPGTGSSSPRNITQVGNEVYFTATSPTIGTELCRLNLSTNSVELFDLYAGSTSSGPEYLLSLDNKIFFSAHINTSAYPNRGRELASYGGTTLGVADLMKGTGSSNPCNFYKVGSTLYFAACGNLAGPTLGYELWRRGPNNSGTAVLKDINPGIGSSLPGRYFAINDTLFFTAFNGSQRELYKTAGTTTKYAGDINGSSPNSGLYDINQLEALNSSLFFIADNGNLGVELWKYTAPTAAAARREGNGDDDNETAIQEMNGNFAFVYPNPVKETLYVRSDLGGHFVAIKDVHGTELIKTINADKVDVSQLSPGIYLAEITSEKTHQVLRFVVE